MSNDSKEIDLIYRIAGHLADGDTLDEELATVVDFAVTLTQAEECCTFRPRRPVLVPWVWNHVEHSSLNRIPVTVDQGFALALLLCQQLLLHHPKPLSQVQPTATPITGFRCPHCATLMPIVERFPDSCQLSNLGLADDCPECAE